MDPGDFYASLYVETPSGKLTGWTGFGHVFNFAFTATVSVPSDAGAGNYNLFVACNAGPMELPVDIGGPSPLTVAGEPLAGEPLAVVAEPTFTG